MTANSTSLKNYKRLWLGLRSAPSDMSKARILFFNGKTYDDHETYKLEEVLNIVNHATFDKSRPTVMYVHGYIENMSVESIHVIVDAYLKRGDHNILILDWSDLADGNYMFDCVPNMKQFAPILSDALIEMFENGLDVAKFHLVGHSMGGQLSGTVGRTIYQKTNKKTKLKRITALDPAFPLFYYPAVNKPLNKNDAELVDVIHTDAWLYGAPVSTGTVDFWPNSGKTTQPGCPKRNYKFLSDNDLCSHRRSWRFWAESIERINEKTFNAIKCKSWANFKAGTVEEHAVPAYMGIDCSPLLTGDYYLQTTGTYPYSKGVSGVIYSSDIAPNLPEK